MDEWKQTADAWKRAEEEWKAVPDAALTGAANGAAVGICISGVLLLSYMIWIWVVI